MNIRGRAYRLVKTWTAPKMTPLDVSTICSDELSSVMMPTMDTVMVETWDPVGIDTTHVKV